MIRLARACAPLILALTVATSCIPPKPGDMTDAELSRLRGCEVRGSSRPYQQVSPSGKYRGAYQFDRRTWNDVASRHWPSAVGQDPAGAPPYVQDWLARRLEAERGGMRAWPTCGWRR